MELEKKLLNQSKRSLSTSTFQSNSNDSIFQETRQQMPLCSSEVSIQGGGIKLDWRVGFSLLLPTKNVPQWTIIIMITGILYTPVERSGHTSWNVAMRQQLDIYASLVLCKSVPGFPTRHSNVDFAIIRENTEGEYSGLEHQVRSFPLRSIFRTHHIIQLPVTRARTNGWMITVFPWCHWESEDHDES